MSNYPQRCQSIRAQDKEKLMVSYEKGHYRNAFLSTTIQLIGHPPSSRSEYVDVGTLLLRNDNEKFHWSLTYTFHQLELEILCSISNHVMTLDNLNV
jgi:hypothetical protein